jgi:hypothetical protein
VLCKHRRATTHSFEAAGRQVLKRDDCLGLLANALSEKAISMLKMTMRRLDDD